VKIDLKLNMFSPEKYLLPSKRLLCCWCHLDCQKQKALKVPL